MATGNAVYPKYKQSLLTEADTNKSLNQTGTSGTFAALADLTDYTYNVAHQFYNPDIGAANLIGTPQEITTPTVVSGVFDGDNVTFASVTGDAADAIILFRKNTGADTTWRLVLYEDTDVNGLPVTPNGGNIVIQWNGSGIFLISDRNLKENIREVGRLLDQLVVYEFSYKGGNGRRMCGLMAQDVEQIIPEAVIEYERNRKAVNYQQVLKCLEK